MRIVTFGSDREHPLTQAALEVIQELGFVEHVDHLTARDSRDFIQQPRSPAYQAHLADLHPDLFLSAAYARLLPEEVLAIPRLGSINVHPSLLPAYRGVNAIWWALYERQDRVGATVHEMTPQVDGGPILGQVSLPVEPEEDPYDVSRRVGQLVRPLLREVLVRIEETGVIVGEPQRGSGWYRSTPANEVHRLEIDWSQTAAELVRRDRIFRGNIPVGRWRISVRRVEDAGKTGRSPGSVLRRRWKSVDVAVGEGGSVRLHLQRPLQTWVKFLLLHISTGHLRRLGPPKDDESSRPSAV